MEYESQHWPQQHHPVGKYTMHGALGMGSWCIGHGIATKTGDTIDINSCEVYMIQVR